MPPATAPATTYLTPTEAADLLRISDRHLRELTRSGAVPHVRLSERCVRYPVAELERLQRDCGGRP